MLNLIKNWWFILCGKRPAHHAELLTLIEQGELHMHAEKGDSIKDVMFKDAFIKKEQEELIFTIKKGRWHNLFLLDAIYWKGKKYKLSDFALWEWNYFKRVLVEKKLRELTKHSTKKKD